MNGARQAGGLFVFLRDSIAAPMSFDDLLRAQIVNAVSAFDKLVHDLVRIGMVEIFVGRRPPTPKYLAESISLQIYANLIAATIPPKEHLFEKAIFAKFKKVSFQDPKNVADGLSYIWAEEHKWQRIAAGMGLDESIVRTKLRLIADRRNAIVHEADIDPVSNAKLAISKAECDDITDFLHVCGNEIGRLVI